MAKEQGKSRRGKSRRQVVRLSEPTLRTRIDMLMHSPPFGWGVLISCVFALVCSLLAIWASEQPLVQVGRVMTETREVRVEITVEDLGETEARRESARQKTPRVYVADTSYLDEIESSLLNLPRTLASVETVDDVEPTIRAQYRLTDETLGAIRGEAGDGNEPKQEWVSRVRTLMDQLRTRPILEEQDWQRSMQEGSHERIELRVGDEAPRSVPRGTSEVNANNAGDLEKEVRDMARTAGLRGALQTLVANRFLSDNDKKSRPTFRLDDAATTAAMDRAAASVPVVERTTPVGTPIFKRAETLSPSQYELYRAELRHFQSDAEAWRVWLRRAAIGGMISVATLALAGYTALFCFRIRRNPSRMGAMAVLMASMMAIACIATVSAPGWVSLSAVAPVVFVAVICAIAYDQRIGLAFGGILAIMVCVALGQPVGMLSLMLVGVGVAGWQLSDIRDRRKLIKMGVALAIALGIGMVLAGLMYRPLIPTALRQTFFDAGLAAFGGILVASVTLFILPLIERAFDITTGMTLIELRDPKQALLRELQIRAPGTYNHSMNVASIAEAAADTIGADPLLTYVGALYHDIGKMNKPEYFVENQAGATSKHEKLSPAMSLLVIVGHVKDGVEMAREGGLPRTIQHFIEAHHGTTLVEYFYHRARKKAAEKAEESGKKGEDIELPEEIEYRYPGPKPKTKEVAILMLADAVESATRTLAEPTPSRIDALVRELANKRLLDGQFDECDLTLRELHTIVGSISKTVASIYHGRISYPAGEGKSQPKSKQASVGAG